MSTGIIYLGVGEATERQWNFRDDIHQHYFGTIPLGQVAIRRSDRGWIVRFQRTGGGIELATNRTSQRLRVGTLVR